MKRTSLLTKNKLAAHITSGGLADETYDFVEELNREAERTEQDVRYTTALRPTFNHLAPIC
jgi:hypothetical protein